MNPMLIALLLAGGIISLVYKPKNNTVFVLSLLIALATSSIALNILGLGGIPIPIINITLSTTLESVLVSMLLVQLWRILK